MSMTLSRRRALALTGGLAGLALAPAAPLRAQERYIDLTIRGGQFRPVSVAVTNFVGEADGPHRVGAIITANFRRSVFLSPVDPKSFPEQIANPDQPPQLDLWRAVAAQFVVTGRTGKAADGRMRTEFRLWDATSGQQVAGQQYVTDANNGRRVAHIVSDAIFARITGEKGVFDSRVVFVDESGPKERRRKRLAIMDQDGANVKFLTRGDDLVVTPRFSPSSQDVTFMSFGQADPRVFLLNIESGQREVVGNFPGMTFAPRFSPDGQRVIMSLAQGSAANLFAMDLRSRATTRLSDATAIDTSPCYSPDGSQIVFESDRGGAQQIYLMSANGSGAKRISFGEGRYSTPVWSPRGDLIAFTKQKAGAFSIGVMRPDGSGERILTEGFHNEGPTFAPNGLYVMFFRDPGGQSGAKIFMADVFGRAEFAVPTPAWASDPAWGPLLS
ncbi:MAG: Tol-Pal system protein TolB [Methylobacteriaceae bacterium]|nr:Tol-Pal system protein TolB [Methylobacteriaceae bacterium]